MTENEKKRAPPLPIEPPDPLEFLDEADAALNEAEEAVQQLDGRIKQVEQKARDIDTRFTQPRLPVPPIMPRRTPTKKPESKPESGKTFEGQSDEAYCLECLPGDTKLYTTKSVYPIIDLHPRYTVLGYDGNYEKITKRFRRHYEGDLIKITFYYLNVPLRLTPEHPIFGVKDVRKPQSTWQDTFEGSFEADRLEWIPAAQFTTSDFIAFPRIRETKDVGIVTEDLAELIGWYIAEGHPTRVSRGWNIEFSLGKHEGDYVARISDLIEESFGVEPSVDEKETALVVRFSTSIFAPFFVQFGKVAHEKRIPDWTLRLPENKQYRILRGMIRGDGDKTKESVRYSTVSEHLAYDLRLLLARLGILHGIHYGWPPNSEIDGRVIKSNYPAWLFTIGGGAGNKLGQKIGFERVTKTDKNWGWVTPNYLLIPTRKVEKEHFEGTVYNLHVENAESYTSLHGVMHNCVEGHTMSALTEMRHALDRHRTAGKMTGGVTEKVRVAIAELMGINEDVRSLEDADPEVAEGLKQILDEARWIRKEYGMSGKGLTRGYGSQEDLEELRNRILIIQNKAYKLVEECPTCKVRR